jgi:hypothetical protein
MLGLWQYLEHKVTHLMGDSLNGWPYVCGSLTSLTILIHSVLGVLSKSLMFPRSR